MFAAVAAVGFALLLGDAGAAAVAAPPASGGEVTRVNGGIDVDDGTSLDDDAKVVGDAEGTVEK
jgi:hypothetical protein